MRDDDCVPLAQRVEACERVHDRRKDVQLGQKLDPLPYMDVLVENVVVIYIEVAFLVDVSVFHRDNKQLCSGDLAIHLQGLVEVLVDVRVVLDGCDDKPIVPVEVDVSLFSELACVAVH